MNTDELLKLKNLLDEGMISQDEFDKFKEQYLKENNPKPKNKDFGLAFVIGIVVVICIAIISSGFNDNELPDDYKEENNSVEYQGIAPEAFVSRPQISISGKMYDNVIGFPELSLSITNNSQKNISAIKFYFLPVDVYGEEISGIFATNNLYTDNLIVGGQTSTRSWQMLDSSIKGGYVYVYSIYFEDGTEWGDKEAPVSDIKKYGYKLRVKY